MASHAIEKAPGMGARVCARRYVLLWLCLAFGALMLAGCSYKTRVGEVERTDLSEVEHGVSRQGIEEDLGPPVAGTDHDLGRLDIYPYDTGRYGKEVGMTQGIGGFDPAMYLIFGIIVAAESIGADEEQEGHLAVLYNKKQEAKWVWKGGVLGAEEALKDGQAELEKLLANETIACVAPDGGLSMVEPRQCLTGAGAPATWPRTEEQAEVLELRTRAQQGDAEAMYSYAVKLRSNQQSNAFEWFCRSAHAGHAEAQYTLGNYYRLGMKPISEDLVNGYLWHRLAAANGLSEQPAWENRVRTTRNWLEERMTPDQLAEAERLAAAWQPNPAACETVAAQAQSG